MIKHHQSLNVFSDYRPSYIDEFNEINFTILDIKDKEKLIQILKGTYIVVSLLPPFLHFEIAKICSKNKINMIEDLNLNGDFIVLYD